MFDSEEFSISRTQLLTNHKKCPFKIWMPNISLKFLMYSKVHVCPTVCCRCYNGDLGVIKGLLTRLSTRLSTFNVTFDLIIISNLPTKIFVIISISIQKEQTHLTDNFKLFLITNHSVSLIFLTKTKGSMDMV